MVKVCIIWCLWYSALPIDSMVAFVRYQLEVMLQNICTFIKSKYPAPEKIKIKRMTKSWELLVLVKRETLLETMNCELLTYSLVSKVMMMRMGLLFMPPTQLLLHMKLYRMVVNSVPTWNTTQRIPKWYWCNDTVSFSVHNICSQANFPFYG